MVLRMVKGDLYMPDSLYEWTWVFLLYAVLGWCCEVMFAAVNEGRFVNRGFLAGPVCPVYGCGVAAILFCLLPVADNLFVLFAGSVLVTSLIEFITGFVLEKIFHQKWWDYSDQPFQIGGYVCLKFSLLWGLACVLVVRVVHPMIIELIRWVHPVVGAILLGLMLLLLAVDLGMTVGALLKIKKRLRVLQQLEDHIRELAEGLGENLAAGTSAVVRAKDRNREELEELKRRYEQWGQERDKRAARFYRAFPSLSRIKESELSLKIRDWIDTHKEP